MLGKLKISCVLIVLLSVKTLSQGTVSADTLGYIYFNALVSLYSPYDSYYFINNKCGNTEGIHPQYVWYPTNNSVSIYLGRNYVWQGLNISYSLIYDHGEDDWGITDPYYIANYVIMPMRVAYVQWITITSNSALLKFSPGSDQPYVEYKPSAAINITMAYDQGFNNKVIYDNTFLTRSDSIIWKATHLITNLQPNTKYYIKIARAYLAGYWCNNYYSISPYMYYSFTTLPAKNNKPILQTIMQTR